jgi:penicillin-binding protein 1C
VMERLLSATGRRLDRLGRWIRPWLGRRLVVVRKMALPGVLLAAVAMVAGVVAAWSVPLPERLVSEPSTVLRDRDGVALHVFLAPDERWRIPVALEEVDPDYLDALLRFEDKRFEGHLGVDGLAILRAAGLNASSGRVVSGGSTITMQLVRLLEPRPRTVRSKVVEAFRAVQLELRLSKREILQAYLQFIPCGRNVEGIEAGTLTYFGHSAEALSAAEIATLLAVPQNPARRYPSTRNAERLRAARDDIASRLLAEDALDRGLQDAGTDEEVLAAVLAAPVPEALRPMPRRAPHAAWWMHGRHPERLRIETTLDRGVQRAAEELLSEARRSLEQRGIRHGAVVVVDHGSMKVRALAGNLSFWNGGQGSQIPAFAVPRSPGSTLKPFLYAHAIDRGVALPDFLVADVPVAYGGYSPRNYDGGFDGLVELEDALSRSLNVPFVNLLGDVGVEPFLGRLRRMGAGSLSRQPGHYGLSVAVGGVELTPIELAGLYAVLARGGAAGELTWEREDGAVEPADPDRVYSEAATWLTRRALAIRDRPDFPSRRKLGATPRAIHWKTGTSTGRRDAWAVGSGPTYTVAVWLGNLDNEPSSHLVGAEAAGPLLFDLLELLHRGARSPLDPAPSELREIEVCSYSGHPPTEACPQRKRTLARHSAVPTTACPFHVKVDVDEATGLALTPPCRDGRTWSTRSFVRWPSSVRRWVRAGHRQLPEPPRYAPECAPPVRGHPPAILHPPAGHVALIVPGLETTSQQMPLEAEATGAEELTWFVDGELLGQAPADERVWWTPETGRHEILVADARGRSTRRWLEVRVRD